MSCRYQGARPKLFWKTLENEKHLKDLRWIYGFEWLRLQVKFWLRIRSNHIGLTHAEANRFEKKEEEQKTIKRQISKHLVTAYERCLNHNTYRNDSTMNSICNTCYTVSMQAVANAQCSMYIRHMHRKNIQHITDK